MRSNEDILKEVGLEVNEENLKLIEDKKRSFEGESLSIEKSKREQRISNYLLENLPEEQKKLRGWYNYDEGPIEKKSKESDKINEEEYSRSLSDKEILEELGIEDNESSRYLVNKIRKQVEMKAIEQFFKNCYNISGHKICTEL